jgi:hypothetical protein
MMPGLGFKRAAAHLKRRIVVMSSVDYDSPLEPARHY